MGGYEGEDVETLIRGTLGRLLFSGDEVKKAVNCHLRRRAGAHAVRQLMLMKPNVLLMDEPTNHLDMESIESLNTALEKFKGTLVFVSHDREFVSRWRPASGKSGTAASSTIAATTRNTWPRRAWPKPVISRLCRLLLRLFGWQLVFAPPPSPKTVIIGYPHTSNWDFSSPCCGASPPVSRCSGWRPNVPEPAGRRFQRWGGIPLDRSRPEGFIEQVCAEFDKRDVFTSPLRRKERANGPTTGRPAFSSPWRRTYRSASASWTTEKQLGIADWIVLSGDRCRSRTHPRLYADKRGYRPGTGGRHPLQGIATPAG